MFLLFVCLYLIWLALWNGRGSPHVRIACAFMLGLLIHQTFEISFTQSDVAVGLMQWLILAIAVSKCDRVSAKASLARPSFPKKWGVHQFSAAPKGYFL